MKNVYDPINLGPPPPLFDRIEILPLELRRSIYRLILRKCCALSGKRWTERVTLIIEEAELIQTEAVT